MKLIILHTESSPHWGGQEIRIFNECCWFKEKGHEVVIVAPKESELAKRSINEGLKVIYNDFGNVIDFMKLVILIWKYKPSVVNTHSNIDSKIVLTAAYFLRVPVRIRSRHISNPINPSLHNKLLYGKLSNYVLTTGDCISNTVMGSLKVPASQVMTIPTGIRILPSQLKVSKEEARAHLCEKIFIDPSKPSILLGIVAVLRSWKGHVHLIEALEQSPYMEKNIHLIIAGDGPAREWLEEEAENRGVKNHVHFLGHQENVSEIFNAIDMAFLTSIKNEGIPQSLLQAMFLECPVAGTNVGGIPEILMEGRHGFLVEPNSSGALREVIEKIWTEPNKIKETVKVAKGYVEENHSMDHMGERVLSVITKVLGR